MNDSLRTFIAIHKLNLSYFWSLDLSKFAFAFFAFVKFVSSISNCTETYVKAVKITEYGF